MKRLMLGLCLAMLAASGGCCCMEGSGWTPFPWPGCGWDPGCGWNGGGCGWGGWNGWACNRPGGCGEVYTGDLWNGNPHCSTCDGCGNWVGPPSPGGTGVKPEIYGQMGPYGQQVARNYNPSAGRNVQLGRSMPPKEYSPQMVRRSNPRQYSTRAQQQQMARNGGPRPGPRPGPNGQQNGDYEGAVQYLGTTDRLVKAAEIPPGATTTPPAANVARRNQQPTLADPQDGPDDYQDPRVQRTSQRTYVR